MVNRKPKGLLCWNGKTKELNLRKLESKACTAPTPQPWNGNKMVQANSHRTPATWQQSAKSLYRFVQQVSDSAPLVLTWLVADSLFLPGNFWLGSVVCLQTSRTSSQASNAPRACDTDAVAVFKLSMYWSVWYDVVIRHKSIESQCSISISNFLYDTHWQNSLQGQRNEHLKFG